MIKSLYAIALMAVLIFPASFAECQDAALFSSPEIYSQHYPVPDTIYVYDTIVQYTFIYDTLFYADTLVYLNEAMPGDTIVTANDSIDFSNKGKIIGLPDTNREPSQNAGENKGKQDRGRGKDVRNKNVFPESQREMSTESVTIKNKTWHSQQGEKIRTSNRLPFVFYVKDTLYRADTIVIFENLTDTVYYYKLNARSDTLVTRHTIIEERQNLVVVNNVVNVNIREKDYVVVDESAFSVLSGYLRWNILNDDISDTHEFDGNYPQKTQERLKRNTQRSHFKSSGSLSVGRDMDNASGSPVNYRTPAGQTFFQGGFSLFIPGIDVDAENITTGQNTVLLNENTTGGFSYGISAGLKYSRQHWAIETGFGFTKFNYNYFHSADQVTIDSSDTWNPFLREAFHYDTTWYFDLDKFLETGIWDSIPSVDSTQVWIQDSTMVRDYDTTSAVINRDYRYSFTFFEIPLVARYPVLKGNFFIDIAAGLIPSFLISKQGKILSDETELVIETEDLTFEYGFNLAFYGAVTIGFKMNEKCALLVEPYVKKTILTGLHNDHIRMKTNAWGIQFAVSYRL